MDDGDHEGLRTALQSDPRLIVATALATLVLAGGVFILRSNPRHIVGNSHNQLGESARRDPDSIVTTDHEPPGPETFKSAGASSKGSSAGTAIIVRDELGEESETKDLKVSRPKERRRRGKDPSKDILKYVKKTKYLARPSRTGDLEDNGVGQSNTPSKNEVTCHSRKSSQATSSRSRSCTSNQRSPLPSQGRASPYPSSTQGSHTGDGYDEDEEDTPPAASSSTFATSYLSASSSQRVASSSSVSDSHTSSSILVSDPPNPSRTAVYPTIPLSSSSSASQSASTYSSDSVKTPNTSPTISQSGKTPTLAQVDMPPHAPTRPMATSASSPSVHAAQKPLGPWDWDGAGPSTTSDGTHRKPPRFHSKSRGSGSNPISPSIPASVSLDTYTSDLASSSSRVSSPTASTILSLGDVGLHEDLSHVVTLPSSDASSKASPSSPISPGSSHTGSNTHFNGNGNANGSGHTPRRAPTPRRPPTPLSGNGTPPPSLSAQTQLASLRGALEAARLREEKTKADIERYSKELDMMRWESAAWRRKEAELQTQVHHMAHQLQSYGALFASMSGQPSPLPQHHIHPGGNPNVNGNSNPTSNGYHFSPSSPNPHSPPPHLQIPSTQMFLGNGILSTPSMFSPMAMAHSPRSPFYPYSPHPNPLLHQQQAQSPLQQSSNLFSMIFPNSTNVSGTPGSGPSSVAGSSSGGSHSPDLAGSSTPPPTLLNRGRRLTRTRTQTAGPRIGGSSWEGEGSDGLDVGDDEVPANGDDENSYDDEDDDEGRVSEVLVDAILKRPGSIRGLSKKGKFKEKDEVQHTEFTFPSLSDFGNVNRMYSVPVDVTAGGGDMARSANDESRNHTQQEVIDTPRPESITRDVQQRIPS
ncbi:hypothetical protein FPV67DRAFT_1449933 [Lyophyllum atratum]|nr:hypothetical protein FPV67DRAFT_1449933 [Lyophyllum atratum]